ncbi:MAG: amino acid permease [Thermoanaerobaculia bacterium]|nr:amino acid permease [Thermoanaerobaculia bacterium]
MSEPSQGSTRVEALGLWTLTSLVVGNMIGSGVFLLPASLAPYGGVSFLGWLVTAGGSMAIGLVFARLARRMPAAGGPYAYTREAFGDFAGFLVGWGYWISSWSAVAAIAVAMVGYLGDLVPAVKATPVAAAGSAIVAIVLLTAVNVAGVRQAGLMQLATTVIKILPLVAVALFGLSRFDAANFQPFNPTGGSLFAAVQACLTLTLWAFLGLEAATVPAGDVRDARRTIPRATLLGIAIAATLYIAATAAVMGMVPRETLAQSTAPFADAARAIWGSGAGTLVALGAFVSCFGALNGWILVASQVPMAIARHGLFPAFFARLSPRGTPALGLALSSTLACLLVVANYTKALVAMFTGMILLSTLASLIPFVFCAMADLQLTARARARGGREPLAWGFAIAAVAFVYGLVATAGSGQETVFWGFLTLMCGIPFYVLARWRSSASPVD